MCRLEIHPLLYISTPSYFDVNLMEESTSIYERPSHEKIHNSLIARQLHYFCKPMKEQRQLLFVLVSGEKIWASIEQINGCEVKLNCFDMKRMIDANDIMAIYRTA